MVMWANQPNIGWKLIRYTNDDGTPNGYYDFVNCDTGEILHPSHNTLLGDDRVGVLLDGAGGFGSTIKAWDDAENKYYGYTLNNGQVTASDEQEEWFFGVAQTTAYSGLHEVETLDSTSMGVEPESRLFSIFIEIPPYT